VTTGSPVRVRGLAKRYGDKQALDGIDLEVGPGELRGLLGPNGAGKTTLLRALFGLIRPDAGSIELLGRARGTGRAIPLDGVAGFVEQPAFYPYLSGRANLELLSQIDDVTGRGVDDALERVGLGTRSRDRVGGYSTGMRQRLGIAAALLRQPTVLLLDEPTSGLDPEGTRAVSALLRELSAQGVAVILSSHLIGELEAICHSYTIIRGGRVVWDGSSSRLDAEAPGSVYSLSTGDDRRAIEVAQVVGAQASFADGVRGIRVLARPEALDAYTVALGRHGIGVRRLELLVSPLESMFFALTESGEAVTPDRITGRSESPPEAAIAP
jgi:ABC-2 type transport system ATP-binding protein